MKLSDFDYYLPKELIAQYPLRERDEARLLILDRVNKAIQHCTFRDIAGHLRRGDLLVLNDTRVLPSRLKGSRLSGGRVEVLLLNHKGALRFDALIKPSRIRVDEKIVFNSGEISGVVTAKNEITFSARDLNAVYDHGQMPLPPYIKREPEGLDNDYYQTVYARKDGAIASPTAGLHFTPDLLKSIAACGTDIAYLTLHVGYGTFRPVKSQDIREHKMEAEYFYIPEETVKAIENARRLKGRIFAVGTTSLRSLETYALGKRQGETGLFIYPGFKFKVTDCLLTNFHLPRTTLFMLVSAFAGEGLIRRAYQEAIERKYRFYSYGDAMLII